MNQDKGRFSAQLADLGEHQEVGLEHWSYDPPVSYRENGLDLSTPIAELRLARPESRNAMTEAMGAEIERAF